MVKAVAADWRITPRVSQCLRWGVPTLVVVLFSLAFLRTAWVSDDAFITFRAVDNTLNGLGPVWNPGERVQVFTHPLWYGLLVPLVALVRDPFHAVIGLSYGLLLLVLALTGRAIRECRLISWLPIVALLWSRAFIDYSSSGLENPLTHALLASFVVAGLSLEGRRQSLALALIASGIFLSRPDALVLIAPALVMHLWHTRQLGPLVIGLTPAVAWCAFSLFYYGAPVPNTALAKVGTGQSWATNAWQAWQYLEWTAVRDPVTLGLLFGGVACGMLSHRLRPLATGLMMWIGYLFYVGADYMGGRFFSAPVLLAAIMIGLNAPRAMIWALGASLVAALPILGVTLLSPARFNDGSIAESGIADERGFYYPANGLMPAFARGTWEVHPWLLEGKIIRGHPGWFTRCTVGMAAYAAGPDVRWIDPLALTEPFLARLPARSGARVGHYERAMPEGFLDSLLSGENRVRDPALHALFADVTLATRAPLLEPLRLGAIWRLNTGAHRVAASSFDREAIGLPGEPVRTKSPQSCFGVPYGGDGTWRVDGPPAFARRVLIRR